MPELPEVETVKRGLTPAMQNKQIKNCVINRHDLRRVVPADAAMRLSGTTVHGLRRRGKYLILDLSGQLAGLIHLGMSGRMMVSDPDTPADKHDHVILTMADDTQVRFNDPRRFGFFDVMDKNQLADDDSLNRLGPEPLSDGLTLDVLDQGLSNRSAAVKNVLLDQSVIAGLGNIYVCEALYYAGISPRRAAKHVPGARSERLLPAIRDVLKRAIAGGGSSLNDYRQADGELGYFQHDFAVYDQAGEICPNAVANDTLNPDRHRINRITQSGRSTYYCPGCQR